MTAIETTPPGPPARSWIDRVLDALPIIGLVIITLTFYGYEAWLRKTPWLFSDEDEWAQISRAIATTGHAARRGAPISFKSLYAFLIAPMWWIKNTHTAYTAIKYLDAVVMCAAAIPTYLLGRMLVSKRSALAAAVLAIAIPGMSYATFIIPEPLAYPWFALCSWLIVRALTTQRRRDVVVAIVFTLIATEVKDELVLLIPSYAVAAAGLWVTGPRGRAFRRNWTRSDTFGALVLLVGAIMLVNRVVLDRSYEWYYSSTYFRPRLIHLGLTSVSALAIGLGLLPAIAGLVALRLRERSGEPAYRAFAAFLATSIIFVSLYAATKAAYLSTLFATLTEERNLFYLSPLLLVATMLVLESRRPSLWVIVAAAVFVLWIVVKEPYQLGPYYEAPGFSILTLFNTHWNWDLSHLHWGLFTVWVIGLALVAAAPRFRGVKTVAVVLLLGWLLAGEIQATAGNVHLADELRAASPKHLDWVDRNTHGQGVTFLTANATDNNGLWLTEFWNRDLKHVDSLDNTAPGPGPVAGPSLLSADGTLSEDTGTPYVLVNNGVLVQGTEVASDGPMILFRIHGTWKLHDAAIGVTSDGWMSTKSAWTYFPKQSGILTVDLRRTAFDGVAPFAHATIVAGTVKLDDNNLPVLKHVYAVRHAIVKNGPASEIKVNIPVAQGPVRVVVTIPKDETFVPSTTDTRQLGAQVEFSFTPTKKQ
ncbi:MAG TPA: hypothetical protein VG652_11910 [Gaiellaceae bacterium]|nr:hypothetical protein [Gaiellaceae bacterium]